MTHPFAGQAENAPDKGHQEHHLSIPDAGIQLWAAPTAPWTRWSVASRIDILDFPSLYHHVLQAAEGTTQQD